MNVLLKIRYTIPVVKIFPLSTLRRRWIEKLFVTKHFLGLSGAKVIGGDNGNLLLKFLNNCEIGLKGQIVKLPFDQFIFQHVKIFGEWGGAESAFLSSKICELVDSGLVSSKITFIDMGANVGLVSTQTLAKSPHGVKGIAVEPIPVLVDALKHNLASLIPASQVKIIPYALGVKSSAALISIDPRNFGSSSLAIDKQMQSGNYSMEINVVDVVEFANSELVEDDLFVVKSDLESFDCAVLATLPDDVWARVFAGVIEVTSDANVDISRLPKLLVQLARYRFLSWDADQHRPTTLAEIQDFWESELGEIRNLFFSN